MTLSVIATLPDGSTTVRDDADGFQVVLKPGQWAEIHRLPDSEQRTRAEQFVLENRADPTGGRTQRDEETMRQAENASTGEAHQEQERG